MTTRRQTAYLFFREHHFLHFEALAYSTLTRNNRIIRTMVRGRMDRWERFVSTSEWKVSQGVWRNSQLGDKWLSNLKRYYRVNGWSVKTGPKGRRKGFPRGYPSPWAAYRDYEQRLGYPDKGYESPWEQKKYKKGKSGLDFVALLEAKSKKQPTSAQLLARTWLAQKAESIKGATGKRRERLQAEYDRLNRLA